MFILIDNYDSFTWNLWHFLSDLGAEVEIIRNDVVTVDAVLAQRPEGLILSPGPGTPEDAGILIELIRAAAGSVPVLGVCLGHQALAVAFGGRLLRIDPPVHGKLSRVRRSHANAVATDIFADCPQDFPVTRYHSLVAETNTLPDCLEAVAFTQADAEDRKIMAVHHKEFDIYGVQFHPESIASAQGYKLLRAFLAKTGQNTFPSDAKMAELENQLIALDKLFPDQVHV